MVPSLIVFENMMYCFF